MEISKDAKARLENRVARIVGNVDVYESDKKEIVRELSSHFYDASMMRAEARGSKTIEREDVEAAIADSEDPQEVAAAYMKTYVDSLARAGIISRSLAFLIDIFIFVFAVMLLLLLLTLPLIPFFPGQITLDPDAEDPVSFKKGLAGVVLPTLWGVGTLVASLTYFVVLEGRFGYTPGKWFLGLRVLTEDGKKIGYVESILRNLPKLLGSSSLLIIDALIMVILFRKERQRGFDKIARTIVVHKNQKSKEAK